ncbi:unnamed protein product [Mytilus coruscus]|uniref:Major facilitator superfamily (MFS) profile domain-containing protein n=1 Tax=Mytilus coruscus TaxID=42192 RepID=A0A6J8BTZ2_MYTCO|nr:unnamed protein product [Mytilus coruscus]
MFLQNFTLYLSGFLDLFGVSMIFPLLSTHVRDLGASSTLVGTIGSIYGGIQLLSSPLVGRWSDVSGRRFCLLWCLLLTATGYITLAIASTLTFVMLARIVNGLFKHSQSLTKSLLADLTSKEDQSAVLGTFNAASSFGFIVGPLIGGHVAETSNGFQKVGLISAFVFIANSVLIYMCVEDRKKTSSKDNKLKPGSEKSRKKVSLGENNFSPKIFLETFHSVNWSKLWDLFLIKFCMGFSIILFRSNFSLVMREAFQITPKTIGYLMSYSGCVSAFFGLLVGYIAKLYNNDAKLFMHMAIFQVVTLFMLSIIHETFWLYVLFLTPLSFITTVSRVAGTSLTIQRGERKEIGTLLGFSQSVMSIARMLGPFISGLVLDINKSGPAFIGGVVTLVAVCIMIVRPQGIVENSTKIVKPEKLD